MENYTEHSNYKLYWERKKDMPLDEKQFCEDFVQKMRNRMLTSYHKYGDAKDTRKFTDFMKNAYSRMKLYEETGNTEWLVDAGNFIMMEYAFPIHPNAHFRATSSSEAPSLDHFA